MRILLIEDDPKISDLIARQTLIPVGYYVDVVVDSSAAIKQALNESGTNALDRQLDLERDLQRDLGRSEDFREGVAAFLAKRPAQFKGR